MSDTGLSCFSELYAGLPLLAIAAIASGIGLMVRIVRLRPGATRKAVPYHVRTTR